MFRVVELLYSRRVPQVAVLALMSIGFAGCSADMSTRLSENPFSNPFASQPEATASVPTAPVERHELPQYARPQSPSPSSAPAIAAPQSYPSASAGSSGGGRGITSYAPPGQPLETTGSAAPRSVAANHGSGHGGTTIIVGTSDTLDTLSRRYNVSPAAILQANGYKGPRALSPGQQLIIPRPTAAAAAPALAAPASKAVAATSAAPSIHVVNHGDTLLSIARRNHVSVAELAKANSLDPQAKLKLGTKLTVPGAKIAAAAQPTVGEEPATALAPPATKIATATGDPQQKVRLAQATTTPAEVSAETPVKASEATGALPTFRWPVRGKVITSYGAKTNGKANDGINLAVPEGTPVKAAEDGVVAYSGNELKGYGNLVLVRHSNGYVTAYAHASELLVKRGDTIKRGQIIAKSGQSGEVGSPQLHFEIRKGSSPVDPLQFLNGA
ncbi:MAG TPA: peptidoglycan DD-metalloendopeptidase family protein [Bradyrhizobium sp.]|nr:peptidoglycan DD-metalloendopeptidase family protein [Bradyrhizobium sp.]